MKKIACLSAVAACVLAVTAGTAFAGQSTVSGGYAQGDLQGVANKADGFNLKYRYEFDNSPLGVIGSFTHLEKDRAEAGQYKKAQYNSITAGPAYRFNDWASIYGVIGVGYGKNVDNAQNGSSRGGSSDYGFSYGAGLQFNPIQDVALDVGYEQSRIRSVDVGIWSVGVGYRF
ncbi:outer membrane protein OmpX [Serratia odorifera]|jgi:outer membrane protein X|uniref:Outer membrane protein X n=2 Tax=Serratia odorifera TaxID=618 RepID=D4E900_SEROD|nr:outer membrane protein OmpX [Serratia odorifera]EFE93766.1 outer membrane protein X [Serratia odorifera DSM 4582]MBJ2064118.1 outer membrane protein OmpX [Serratia odorifera]PNK88620.1 outer membrane protein OmpX [Serratia odorifera]RII69585.1 outer membrane protein OmpX [Serratia odorifera]VDZ65367.1 Outer membrane protein X precursor [Serratia odorifera]